MNELLEKSIKVRESILKMSINGGCFTGSALSCSDIILFLYSEFLNISKENLESEDRDYFFLSKGHAVPALYSVLAETVFFDKEKLTKHLSISDDIYWHPNRKIPGVEYHSGSLGQLLSISIGVAFDLKLLNKNNKIVCLLGDGELNEGSIWESFLVASAYKLSNLIIIIDRNQIQANRRTEELIPLEPLDLKLSSFGLKVHEINGHDFSDMMDTFSSLDFNSGRPNVIIANTFRGKGIHSIEDKVDKWFCNLHDDQLKELLNELNKNN